MLGSDIVKANIMGLDSGNNTRGMRFTGEQAFSINNESMPLLVLLKTFYQSFLKMHKGIQPKHKLHPTRIHQSQQWRYSHSLLASTQEKKGSKTQDLLENIVDTAIKNIPIARPMHWGDLDFNFMRPVHWLVMML
jgi:glycyl-tRNA synthetase beta subunit